MQVDTTTQNVPLNYVRHDFAGGADCTLTGAQRTAEVRGDSVAHARACGAHALLLAPTALACNTCCCALRCAQVRFMCMRDAADNIITAVKEFPTCHYVLTVATPFLCKAPEFKPPVRACQPAHGTLHAAHASPLPEAKPQACTGVLPPVHTCALGSWQPSAFHVRARVPCSPRPQQPSCACLSQAAVTAAAALVRSKPLEGAAGRRLGGHPMMKKGGPRVRGAGMMALLMEAASWGTQQGREEGRVMSCSGFWGRGAPALV